MNWREVELGLFPSSQWRGGRAINKMDPFRNRRGRGGQFGEAIQA